MNYQVVYDAIYEEPTRFWVLPLLFVLFGTMSWLILRGTAKLNLKGNLGLPASIARKMAPIFFPIFIGLSAIALIFLLIDGKRKFSETQERLRTENYKVIDGKVSAYYSYKPSGVYISESFIVDSTEFSFKENDHSYYGYRPNSESQIIYGSLHLRISFYTKGQRRIILRVEKLIED
ncbi:MAG: hypothetical protein ACI865_000349 [Flavobacteriaceae bacterium]